MANPNPDVHLINPYTKSIEDWLTICQLAQTELLKESKPIHEMTSILRHITSALDVHVTSVMEYLRELGTIRKIRHREWDVYSDPITLEAITTARENLSQRKKARKSPQRRKQPTKIIPIIRPLLTDELVEEYQRDVKEIQSKADDEIRSRGIKLAEQLAGLTK